MINFNLVFSRHAKAQKSQPLTEDLFYRVAGSEEVARIVNHLKGLDKHKDEAEYREWKLRLPLYHPMCVYMTEKRPAAKHFNVKPSGLCMHDFDDMTEDPVEVYKQKIEPLIGKEIDLVLAHLSCGSHGLRLIDILPEGMTPEQHQLQVACLLGMTASKDDSIKDYPRGSFFPSKEQILFIDNERFFTRMLPGYEEGDLFATEEMQHPEETAQTEDEPAQANTPYYNTGVRAMEMPEGAFSVIPSYEGVPLNLVVDEIVKGYCTDGKLTQEGHQRDNLCFHAALCLRPLVDSNFDVIYGLLEAPLGCVGFSDAEIRQKITSALSRTTGYTRTPSPETAYILNKLKREINTQKVEPILPKAPKMPKIMEDVAALFPAWLHDACILAQLPIWGFMADNVMVQYSGGRWKRLQFSTHIIAGAASGKGFIVPLKEILMQRFADADKEVLRKEENDRQNRKRKEKKQGEDVEYNNYRKYFLEANITRPQAYVRLNNAAGHMMMVFTEEVGEFDATMRSSSNGFKYVLLKSFDFGEITKATMSDDSPNIACQVSLNALTAGTAASTSTHLGNNSDGLLSRNVVVLLPSRLGIKGDDFDVKIPSEKLMANINATTDRLLAIGNGEFQKFSFPAFRQALVDWFDGPGGVNDQYNDNHDADWTILVRRAGEIGFRAMVLFWFLSGCPKGENKAKGKHSKKIQEIIDAGMWVAEYVRTTQYSVVKSNVVSKDSREITIRTGKNKRVFSALPDTFTTLDYINLKASQGDTISQEALYKSFQRMQENGLIVKIGKDKWQKTHQEEATA